MWIQKLVQLQIANVRRASSQIKPKELSQAFKPELERIKFHSTLINQTSPYGLIQLADVEPLMSSFNDLANYGVVTKAALTQTTLALARSAKDCSIVFRHMLKDDRIEHQSQTHAAIADHCDTVAKAIISGQAPLVQAALGNLINTYEMVDPAKGAAFYFEGDFKQVGGSVIPCLVKSSAPLTVIEQVYEDVPVKSPRVRANIVMAYLKYNEPEKAVEIASQIHKPDCPISTWQFLVSAFVGDCPSLEIARQWFWDADVLPHHSAVSRFLKAAWDANNSVSEQLAIFEKYLDLASGHNEATIKPVVYTVTNNIVQSRGSEQTKYATVVNDVKNLVQVYSKLPEQSLFLNILLTCVSKQWPTKEELIMPIVQAFSADNSSKVTYRVRLNALAQIAPKHKDRLVRSLWSLRCQLTEAIEMHDWFALARADLPLAREIYQNTSNKDASPKVLKALSYR